MFQDVTGIGFDGRRDATLYKYKVKTKFYISTTLEENYVITGELTNINFI